jgi:hypothetical protein
MYSRQPRQSTERGIALVSVLWVLLLLSALAEAATYVVRTNAIVTHRSLEAARAQAAADAAIVHTISQLADEQVSRHPPIGGSGSSWEFEGFTATISVSNEAGRIDANAAGSDLITAFFRSRNIDQQASGALLNAMRAANLRSTLDLQQIPGWNPCWTSAFTVYTGLPGVSPSQAANSQRSLLGEVLRIRATVSGAEHSSASAEWVGRLTGDRRQPVLTMLWEHDVPTVDPQTCDSRQGFTNR